MSLDNARLKRMDKYCFTQAPTTIELNGLQNDDWEEKSITGRGITDSITILVRRSDTIQL